MGEGKGNYGCLGVVDFVGGTSLREDIVEDVRGEAERNHVKGKAKGRSRGAGRKATSRSQS